jgi:hypothetical protein
MRKIIVAPDEPQGMSTACWMPKAINTHSEYVIRIAFPLQKLLQERASVLHHTHIVCFLVFVTEREPLGVWV